MATRGRSHREDGRNVTRQGCKAEWKHFIFRGTAVGYRVIEQTRLEDILTTPTLQWPFLAGALSVLRVLHGDSAQVRIWMDRARTVPSERFPKAIVTWFPALWSATAADEIVPLAERLVGNFLRLLRQEGVGITDYESVDVLRMGELYGACR